MVDVPGMNEEKKRKVNWSRVFIAVVAVLAVIFIVGPGLLGYGVYLQIKDSNYTVNELGQNIHSLERDLEVAKANLSLQGAFSVNLLEMVDKNMEDFVNCKTEKTKLETDAQYAGTVCEQRMQTIREQLEELQEQRQNEQSLLAQETQQATLTCTQNLEQSQKQLEAAQKQLVDTQENHDAFVQNMARNVCCKQKFDNPRINSYSVVGNKLVCLEGGGTSVTCSLE